MPTGLAIFLGLLVLASLGAGAWLALRARRQRQAAEQGKVDPEAEERRRRTASFAKSLKQLDSTGRGLAHRYKVPWAMLVGEPGSGRRSLLESAELHRPFGKPSLNDPEGHCSFWFFDEGLVLRMPGVAKENDDAWKTLLRQVRSARRLRPVDSLIVTLSAHDLLGEHSDGKRARAVGEGIASQLRALQRSLGIRCPVYVVVTKADLIPGFEGFSRAVPARMRSEMLGWSSPHPFDATYSTDWVVEALDHLYGDLSLAQAELLAGRCQASDRDDVLLFPASVRALEEPLRQFLDPLFKPTVYSEPNSFRGLYLCGDPVAPRPTTGSNGTVVTAAPGAPPLLQPVFFTELLSAKVFPERGLARPASGRNLRSRNLLVGVQWALAACLVLAPLGLWSAWASLHRDIPPVAGTVRDIAKVIAEFADNRSDRADDAVLDELDLKTHAEAVLLGMSKIQSERLELITLPASWLSGMDGDIQRAMRVAFEDVILTSYYLDLDYKKTQLLDARPPTLSAASRRVIGPGSIPELVALESLDGELEKLAKAIHSYNELRNVDKHQKLETVSELAAYLFDLHLNATFTQNADLYRDALDRAEYDPVEEPDPVQVRARAEALTRAIDRRLFQENALDVDLKAITTGLATLTTSGETGDVAVKGLREIAAALGRVQHDLEDSEAPWLTSDELGPQLDGLVESVRTSRLLGEPMAKVLEGQWKASHASLRTRLLAYSTPDTGPLLVKVGLGDKAVLALEPKALALRASLEAFLNQGYVGMDRSEPLMVATPGARITWSEDGVSRAAKLLPAYEVFTRDAVELAPEGLRPLLRSAARDQLQKSVQYLVGRARRVEPSTGAVHALESQSQLAAEVASWRRVSEPFRVLLDGCDRLELTSAALSLRGELTAEAGDVLRRIDLLLEGDRLYGADSRLAFWTGQRPAAFDAFDVADVEGLKDYLKAQRARADELARDLAASPVAVLEAVAGPRTTAIPLLAKWQRMLSSLRLRETLTPGNSVSALESYVQDDMMREGRDACREHPSRRPPEGGDFFIARRDALRDAVRKRCDGFDAESLYEAYDRVAARFNRDLAGRFPFAARDSEPPEHDAQPRDVRDLLHELDTLLPELDAYRARSGRDAFEPLGATGREISAFVEQLRDLRRFFGPVLADDGVEPSGRYGLGLELRVNRRYELRANQIIEWRLEVGGRPAELTRAAWRPGDPIRLGLRFAKDGPYAPARGVQGKDAQVSDDDWVSFDYGGTWALLRLIRGHSSRGFELEGGGDVRPHTLKLLVQLEERPGNGAGTGMSPSPPASTTVPASGGTQPQPWPGHAEARTFLRVNVSGSDSRTRLVAPYDWPGRAPVRNDVEARRPAWPSHPYGSPEVP